MKVYRLLIHCGNKVLIYKRFKISEQRTTVAKVAKLATGRKRIGIGAKGCKSLLKKQKSDWKKVLKKALKKKMGEKINNEMRVKISIHSDPFRRKMYLNKENGALQRRSSKE